MPAIDPTRLTRQLEDLKTGSTDPREIARDVIKLIEEYSEPAQHSAASIPAPVMRALRTSLQQMGQVKAISAALWKNGMTDSRLLAAGLLEVVEDADVAATTERWAAQNVIVEVVRELGWRGLSGWRRADPSAFLDQIDRWLEEGKRRSQVLAIYALKGRVIDPDFEDLPSIFGLIDGRVGGSRGELREAMIALIATLGDVEPEETEGFLDEQESSPLTKSLKERINSKRVGVV